MAAAGTCTAVRTVRVARAVPGRLEMYGVYQAHPACGLTPGTPYIQYGWASIQYVYSVVRYMPTRTYRTEQAAAMYNTTGAPSPLQPYVTVPALACLPKLRESFEF